MFSASTHRAIYLVLLSLLGGTMVCSTWAANLVWVLIGANWLAEGRWREKWSMARASKALHLYVAYIVLLAIGLIWTTHLAAGIEVLRVALPLLVVPLVVLTTKPPTGKARSAILWVFTATVAVVSIISAVRLFTIDGLPYRLAVPYISHIRFALCCSMAVCFCVGECIAHWQQHRAMSIAAAMLAVWLLLFLLLIRSYTAIAVLAVVSLIAAIAYSHTRWCLLAWVAVAAIGTGAVAYEASTYYHMSALATAPLQTTTAGGRPYTHACDGIVENGNYINNYICAEELRNEWQRRSALPYDSATATGHAVEPTLVRYLNALGHTKDSVGLWQLSSSQVHSIEQGIANPVYEGHNLLRKMVYVMLFEREYARHTNAVVGFTLLQRIELWRATSAVVAQHPVFGVGTGDATYQLHAQLQQSQSPLAGSQKRTHNQYLTIAAMLGIVGLGILLWIGLRALLPWLRRSHGTPLLPPLIMAWVVAVLLSFITEDTLDTLAGVLFCTWFIAFRPDNTKFETGK